MKRIGLFLCLIIAITSILSAQNVIDAKKMSKHLLEITSCKDVKTNRNIKVLVSLNVQCDANSFFANHNCKVIDSIGRIYIVNIPLNKVGELSLNDTIQRLEAERMPKPAMNVTPQQVNASNVYTGSALPQAYTGAGVVAGVFDCYYDFTHPAFYDAEGNLRIKYYYDFHWQNEDGTFGRVIALQQNKNPWTNRQGFFIANIISIRYLKYLLAKRMYCDQSYEVISCLPGRI